MPEFHFGGMQHLPGRTAAGFSRQGLVGPPAIDRIAQDGIAQVGGVDAYLVRPARQGLKLHQCPLRPTPQHSETGLRRFAIRQDAPARPQGRRPSNRSVNRSSLGIGMTHHQRQVGFGDVAGLKQRCQGPRATVIFGHQHQT